MPVTPSRIRIGNRICESVTVRSSSSPSNPGAKSGSRPARRGRRAPVIAPSTSATMKISFEASRKASRLLALLELLEEDRDERGLDRRVGEQAADEVRDLEGDRERRHRALDPEVARGDDLADQAGDPRERRGDREERRRESRGGLPRLACGGAARERRLSGADRSRVRPAVGSRGRGHGLSSSIASRRECLSPPPRPMANIASQKKRIARTAARAAGEPPRASSVKTALQAPRGGCASGDDADAEAEHQALISRIDKAVQQRRAAPQQRRPQEVPRGQRSVAGSTAYRVRPLSSPRRPRRA